MVESMLGSPRPCLLLALSSNPASSVELVPNGSSPPQPRTATVVGTGGHGCGRSTAWWLSVSSLLPPNVAQPHGLSTPTSSSVTFA